jgi:hypothetical protein
MKEVILVMLLSVVGFGQKAETHIIKPGIDTVGPMTVEMIIFVGDRQCAFIDVQTKAVRYADGCTPDEVLVSVIDHATAYQKKIEKEDSEIIRRCIAGDFPKPSGKKKKPVTPRN